MLHLSVSSIRDAILSVFPVKGENPDVFLFFVCPLQCLSRSLAHSRVLINHLNECICAWVSFLSFKFLTLPHSNSSSLNHLISSTFETVYFLSFPIQFSLFIFYEEEKLIKYILEFESRKEQDISKGGVIFNALFLKNTYLCIVRNLYTIQYISFQKYRAG